jgi:hypothetical protein
MRLTQPTAFSTSPPCAQLTPSSACERAENTGIPSVENRKSLPPDQLENKIGRSLPFPSDAGRQGNTTQLSPVVNIRLSQTGLIQKDVRG